MYAVPTTGIHTLLPPIVRLHEQPADVQIAPALSFPQHVTVAQTLDALHAMQHSVECIYYLFITDPDEHLVGVISLRDLLFATPQTRLYEIMDQQTVSLAADASLEEQAHVMSSTGLLALPVIDERGRLVGAMDATDMIAQLEQRTTAAVCDVAGVSQPETESKPTLTAAVPRLLWQAASLLGALLVAWAVLHSAPLTAAGPTAGALLIGIALLRQAGLVARQTATLTLRRLALGTLHPSRPTQVWAAVGYELRLALLIGAVAAVAVAVLFAGSIGAQLSVLIGATVCVGIILSSVLGVLLPVLARQRQVDLRRVPVESVSLLSDMCGILLILSVVGIVLAS